jgi:hypothetical protein
MKSHDSEKRFSCDKCDKKYVSANNLKVHQKSHQNEKPVFKCPVFGCKSKVTFSHRNRHLMAHRKPEELTQIEEYKRRLESENCGQK